MSAEELIAFEAQVAEHFNAGRIRAPIHLSGGCEEQTIEVFKNIRAEDWVCTNWRSHYHCLLKGVPRERLMADILAGKSITLCYPDFKIFSSAIVGGNLPIALGIALAIKRRGGSERVHVFCGDMTSRTGAYRECLTYAASHDLPIRFIIEDNKLSVCTPTFDVWGATEIWVRGMVEHYEYKPQFPHSGAGRRIEF